MTAGALPELVAQPEAGGMRRRTRWLGWALVALSALALARVVHGAELERAWSLLRGTGWTVALVLLPTLVAMVLDAWGWQAILRTLGQAVSWRRLVPLRLSVEAIVLALPGGSLAGEAAKVAWLRRRAGVRATIGTVSLALTKLALVGSDAAYLALAGLWLCLAEDAPSSIPALLCLGGAVFTGAGAVWLALVLRRSTIASSLARLLSRLPLPGAAAWLERRRAHFETLDDAARGHFSLPLRARLASIVPFALEWVVEGLETLIILRCLGIPIGIGQALALDALGSLLRALVFFVPAGLGIQDAAQMMLLTQLGIAEPVATGTAFIVVKRTKEIFWIAIGLLLLAGTKVPWRRAVLGRAA